MTSPFTTVAEVGPGDYWKAEEWINHLMLVRPTKYQDSGFITEYRPDGMDAVFCDIAVIDVNNDDGQLGRMFRGSAVLQGYLKGTFKRYLGHTLVGTVVLGIKQKGQKPPYQWMDLTGDPDSVAAATNWVQSNPTFLVELTSSAPPQASARPAAEPAAAAAPVQQMSTLAQLKEAASRINHHGNAQPAEAPF